MNEPPAFPSSEISQQKTGLSVASLVLGILALLCLCGIFAGIPAIITGHMARGRARRQPQMYGGAGMALAGLIMGYVSLALLPITLALLLPALAKAKQRAQTITCVSQMKQIGLAARIYSNDHKETYPPDFRSMSNELGDPKILVCPGDSSRTKAMDWSQFDESRNLTYEFLTPNAKESDIMSQTAFRCPIHGAIALGDGSVQQVPSGRRR